MIDCEWANKINDIRHKTQSMLKIAKMLDREHLPLFVNKYAWCNSVFVNKTYALSYFLL